MTTEIEVSAPINVSKKTSIASKSGLSLSVHPINRIMKIISEEKSILGTKKMVNRTGRYSSVAVTGAIEYIMRVIIKASLDARIDKDSKSITRETIHQMLASPSEPFLASITYHELSNASDVIQADRKINLYRRKEKNPEKGSEEKLETEKAGYLEAVKIIQNIAPRNIVKDENGLYKFQFNVNIQSSLRRLVHSIMKEYEREYPNGEVNVPAEEANVPEEEEDEEIDEHSDSDEEEKTESTESGEAPSPHDKKVRVGSDAIFYLNYLYENIFFRIVESTYNIILASKKKTIHESDIVLTAGILFVGPFGEAVRNACLKSINLLKDYDKNHVVVKKTFGGIKKDAKSETETETEAETETETETVDVKIDTKVVAEEKVSIPKEEVKSKGKKKEKKEKKEKETKETKDPKDPKEPKSDPPSEEVKVKKGKKGKKDPTQI